MPRISNLTSLTTPANNDEIAIVDTSASVTKKITRGDLLSGTPLPADTVDTQAIEDGAVTSAKLALSKTTDANGWTVYDYGTFKQYAKKVTGLTTGGNVSTLGSTGIGSTNAPVGVAPNDMFLTVKGISGYDTSRYLINCPATSTTPGATMNITARNVTGVTISDSGMVVTIIGIV